MLVEDDMPEDTYISWSAYHASKQPESNVPAAITALLPLFHEQSKSVAMMRHSLNIVKQTVQFLNPGQIPVVTIDQPLYALASRFNGTGQMFLGKITLSSYLVDSILRKQHLMF